MARIKEKQVNIFLYVNKIIGERPLTTAEAGITYNYQFNEGGWEYNEDWEVAEANNEGIFWFNVPAGCELTIFFAYDQNEFVGSVFVPVPKQYGTYNLNDLIQAYFVNGLGPGPNYSQLGFNLIYWDCYSKIPGQKRPTDWVSSGEPPE